MSLTPEEIMFLEAGETTAPAIHWKSENLTTGRRLWVDTYDCLIAKGFIKRIDDDSVKYPTKTNVINGVLTIETREVYGFRVTLEGLWYLKLNR